MSIIFFIGIKKFVMQGLIMEKKFRSFGLIKPIKATGIGAAKIRMVKIYPS